MTRITIIPGTANDGTDLTAVYAENTAANVAFALIFPGKTLPRFVHWGRPLPHPETLVHLYDALKPQRVSGALDNTAWPSILPTQSEAWIGAQRIDIRRDGRETFCDFSVIAISPAVGDNEGASMISVAARSSSMPSMSAISSVANSARSSRVRTPRSASA